MDSSRATVAAACRSTGITTAAERYDPASAERGRRLVYRHEGTRSLKASGRVAACADQWSVTLYSPSRDEEAELAVEAALADAGIPCGDSMSGFDDEHGIHWTEWDFETPRQASLYK